MPFHKVDGAHVIIKAKRVYRQFEVYTFRGQYFAKKGGGFVALYKNGTGDADDVLVEFYAGEKNPVYVGALGRLFHIDRVSRDCAPRIKLKEGIIENA